jgi:RimJ/RimL family protein N-acetyltransferase
MSWIPENTSLIGETVELLPFDPKHFEALEPLAAEQRIWEFLAVDMSTPEKRFAAFSTALLEREKGTQFPFVVYHKKDKKLVGCTRLMNIEEPHRSWRSAGPGTTRITGLLL